MRSHRALPFVVLALLLGACMRGRPTVRSTPVRTPAEIAAGAVAGTDPSRPLPYDAIVTPRTTTTHGPLTVHFLDGRVHLEIPQRSIGDFLLARSAGGIVNARVVRLERRASRFLLRDVPYDVVAAPGAAIAPAVAALRVGDVIAGLDIVAAAPDGAAVVDVTGLFTGAVSALAALPAIDPERGRIVSAAAFAGSIEIASEQTGATPLADSTRTLRIRWSFLPLPEAPLPARAAVPDVPWQVVDVVDYGTREHRADLRSWIRRFRLDRSASIDAAPITFWIDPATPAWAVPALAGAVHEWRVAFADAGLPDAIDARLASDSDPDGLPLDARRASIRWMPGADTAAAHGQLIDPRTGEILRAWVDVPHALPEALEQQWFVQAAALDARARSLPVPDALAARLLQSAVARSIGRALGLAAPLDGQARYPVDSLRSSAFLRRAGAAPSILGGPLFDIVAQPSDQVPADLLVPRVGPWDRFALSHGYEGVAPPASFLVNGRVPAEEVVAAELQLANLAHAAPLLLPATERAGQDYERLGRLYEMAVAHWTGIMLRVTEVIGGGRILPVREGAPVLHPTSTADAQRALDFIIANAFDPPLWLFDPAVLRRIEAAGSIARVAAAQAAVLSTLLSPARLDRLADRAARTRNDAAGPAALMERVRSALWPDRERMDVRSDPLRRALQRAHVRALTEMCTSADASDARAAAWQELVELRALVGAARARTTDDAARLHLEDIEREIARTLDRPRRLVR